MLNNYYPLNYQNPYQQMQMSQLPQMQNYNNQNPNTLFMRLKTVEEARNYPVAPGTTIISVTDDAKHCCIKSLGTSPFDTPIFNEYNNTQNEIKREIKEEAIQEKVEYATKKELNSYIEQFNVIGNNFTILKNATDELKKDNEELTKENEQMRKELEAMKSEFNLWIKGVNDYAT